MADHPCREHHSPGTTRSSWHFLKEAESTKNGVWRQFRERRARRRSPVNEVTDRTGAVYRIEVIEHALVLGIQLDHRERDDDGKLRVREPGSNERADPGIEY